MNENVSLTETRENDMYVYISRAEEPYYTVGFYDPNGEFHPEYDCNDSEEAAKRVAWLNGGKKGD